MGAGRHPQAAPVGQAGFTLLELLISLAIFAFGMMGITSLFAMQTNINANAIRHNVANNIALNAVEEAKGVPYYRMINWNPADASASVPCQLPAAANLANRADCLRPDTVNATTPPAPYDHFVSDAGFVPVTTLANLGQIQADRAFTKGMEIRRTYTITPDTPAVDMKTIAVQVQWRLAGSNDVQTVAYTTVRDMDIR